MNTPQFAEVSSASVDTVFGLLGQALNGVEQLATLNLQAVKTTLAESVALAQAAQSAKTPEELWKLQSATIQAAPQKLAAYVRQVVGILTTTTQEQRAAAEAQVAEAQAKFLAAVDGALKNAPGSEGARALMKSAIEASNNAYDGVKKASKQVSEAVDANITKITETATRGSGKAIEG